MIFFHNYASKIINAGGGGVFIVKKRLHIPFKDIKQACLGISWRRAEGLLSPEYSSFQS